MMQVVCNNFSQAVGGLITAHSSGVTFSDDRKETTKGHAVYFEDTAKFDKLELSLGARLEHFKMHYRDKIGAGTLCGTLGARVCFGT